MQRRKRGNVTVGSKSQQQREQIVTGLASEVRDRSNRQRVQRASTATVGQGPNRCSNHVGNNQIVTTGSNAVTGESTYKIVQPVITVRQP